MVFLKNHILGVLVIFSLMACGHANASTSVVLATSAHFEIVSTDELSSEASLWSLRAQTLVTWGEEKVVSSLPSDIQEKLSGLRFKIELVSNPVTDGFFWNERMLIQMRKDEFLSMNGPQLFVHEVFHAIHFLMNPDEEVWVREGLAQMFEYKILGHFNGLNITASISRPTTPLMSEYNVNAPDRAAYGHSLLYFYFLTQHCGGADLFWNLVRGGAKSGANRLSGVALINDVGKEYPRPICASFGKSSEAFEVARFLRGVPADESNRRDYTLLSTPAKPRALNLAGHRVALAQLESLDVLEPVLLSGNTDLPAGLDNQTFAVYFLGNQFPYQISRARQHGDFSTLIFKRVPVSTDVIVK